MKYKGTLGCFDIKNINTTGLRERLSELLHQMPWLFQPSDVKEQILLAFHNVEDALLAAGVTEGWKAVYQMTTYHANGMADEVSEGPEVAVGKYFQGNRPAWTGIEVQSLYGGAIIEIAVSAALRV